MANSSSNHLVDTNYFLQPGYIIVPEESTVVSAVVGSGVSVCLFDRKKRVGGMNLFQFPSILEQDKATACYGNVATLALIKMILNQGSKKKHLEAQLFGGAFNNETSQKDIGKDNIRIARQVLLKQNISIISEDVGGRKGRKIVFNTSTNEIAVLKVDNLRSADWYPYKLRE